MSRKARWACGACARERRWAGPSEPAARLAAGSLAGTSQPDVQREAQHDTRRVGRQGGRTRSCDVLALVDLDDLASPVAVPHQRVETAAFAGASCGRTCPVRSPTIRLEQEILG